MDLNLKNAWTTLMESNWFDDILELDLKSTQNTSLDMDWFYGILDLELKNNWTNLLDSDWIYYNKAEMSLEKCENLLDLFARQLVIHSSLASYISLG